MEEKSQSQLEINLVSFLRLFQNRPHHLSKYLLENNCLDESFLKLLNKSEKLKELSIKFETGDIPLIYFVNFKEMMKYFENISFQYDLNSLNTEKVNEELNLKLDNLIKEEKYEEAIRVRDFMIKNNIQRKN